MNMAVDPTETEMEARTVRFGDLTDFQTQQTAELAFHQRYSPVLRPTASFR